MKTHKKNIAKQNKSSTIRDYFKKKNIDAYELAAYIVIGFFFLLYVHFVSGLLHINSPVYGGDFYRDRGFIENIVQGNPIWSDLYFYDELQYYPYGFSVILALIVFITPFTVDQVFLYSQTITFLLGGLTWFFLGKELFKKSKWGLLLTTIVLATNVFIGPKSSEFAYFVMMPLFLLLWLKYEQKQTLLLQIGMGLVLGFTAFVQGARFVTMVGLFAGTVILLFISEYASLQKKTGKQLFVLIQSYFKKYILTTVITIIIASLFFLPLVLTYHFETPNKVTEYGDTKIELLGPSWLLKQLTSRYFNTSSIGYFMYGIIALFGTYALFKTRKIKESQFILYLFIVNVLLMQHHLITKPLFNTWFLPEKLVFLTPIFALIFVFGTKTLYENFSKSKVFVYAFVLLLLIIILPVGVTKYNSFMDNRWNQYGMEPDPNLDSLYSLAEWMKQNVGNDQVTLSNDESGFMLSVLSGKKVMISRRTHASYFVDVDKRIAESAVILFGNNNQERMRLLDEYNIDYFYIDQFLFQYPLKSRPEFAEYLTQYGVEFTITKERLDPAQTYERATLVDLIVIPPQNISDEFTAMLEPMTATQISGQTTSILYRINKE